METLQQWVKTAARELSLELDSAEPTAFAKNSAGTTPIPTASGTSATELSASPKPFGQRSPELAAATAEFTDQNPKPIPTAADQPNLRKPQLNTGEAAGPDSTKSPTPLTNVQRLLQEARQHVRKQDAFDPEDFNRRFAGSRTK